MRIIVVLQVYLLAISAMKLVEVVNRCPEVLSKLYVTHKGVDRKGNQLVDVNISFPESMDNKDLVEVTILRKQDKDKWVHVLTVPHKYGICRLLDTVIGSFWHEIQKANGVAPYTCPIIGFYKMKDFTIDGTKVRIPMLPALPIGFINISTTTVNKISKKVKGCSDYLIQN